LRIPETDAHTAIPTPKWVYVFLFTVIMAYSDERAEAPAPGKERIEQSVYGKRRPIVPFWSENSWVKSRVRWALVA